MERIDLHTHSTCSDGHLSPTELILRAAEKNLRAIALTDHDTIDGLAEAQNAAAKNSIELVNGIELGVLYNHHEYHILGLLINPKSKSLKNNLPDINDLRRRRNEKMLSRLKDLGINISIADFPRDKVVTRAHFAQAIVCKGYLKNISEAFDKYLSPGCPAYVQRELLSAQDGIQLIKESGGIPILAHPLRYKLNHSALEKLLHDFINFGLEGIEALYSANTQADDAFLLGLAKKYRLRISGGSDFHGLDKEIDLGIGYGNLYVPYKVLTDLKST